MRVCVLTNSSRRAPGHQVYNIPNAEPVLLHKVGVCACMAAWHARGCVGHALVRVAGAGLAGVGAAAVAVAVADAVAGTGAGGVGGGSHVLAAIEAAVIEGSSHTAGAGCLKD